MQAFLALDSSTSHLCLSVVKTEIDQTDVQFDFCEDVGRDHAKRILPEIEKLLSKAEIKKSDLTAIAVGLGPGSYTGVRVAMATAKGLARALSLPLYGYPTLEAIAIRSLASKALDSEHDKVIATLDARRDHVYAASYALDKKTNQALHLGDIEKISTSVLEEKLTSEGFHLVDSEVPDVAYFAHQAKQAYKTKQPSKPLKAIYL